MIVSLHDASRMLSDWRGYAKEHGFESVWGAIKHYAKVNGAAGVFRADDSYRLFYRDHDGKIRQKTWRKARLAKYVYGA